jgi:hypothetical protein
MQGKEKRVSRKFCGRYMRYNGESCRSVFSVARAWRSVARKEGPPCGSHRRPLAGGQRCPHDAARVSMKDAGFLAASDHSSAPGPIRVLHFRGGQQGASAHRAAGASASVVEELSSGGARHTSRASDSLFSCHLDRRQCQRRYADPPIATAQHRTVVHRPPDEPSASERREGNSGLFPDNHPLLGARVPIFIEGRRVDEEVADSAFVLPASRRLGPTENDRFLRRIVNPRGASWQVSIELVLGEPHVGHPTIRAVRPIVVPHHDLCSHRPATPVVDRHVPKQRQVVKSPLITRGRH